ncbi:MAG: glucose-6-phosphate dehydrogenase assembly protein OpcA [Chloroflexi bacterium]|nr:glucose-6-phosphate dehydrogenase assembly protein OpcA [Chloroflexota bacterium]
MADLSVPATYHARWEEELCSTLAVEAALNALARRASRTLALGTAARARTSTLIVITTDPASDAQADAALRDLSHPHPSRLIRIRLDPSGTAGVRARPAVRCQVEGEPRCPVVLELVELEIRGEAARHLAQTIAPLLDADVPVVLWWVGVLPLTDPSVRELLPFCRQVVIDSATLSGPLLPALLAELDQGRSFADLAWERLGSWRALLTGLADSPLLRAAIATPQQVTVAGGQAESVLLLGWLANRLGWQLGAPHPEGGDAVLPAGTVHGVLRALPSTSVAEVQFAREREVLTVSAEEEGWVQVQLTRAGQLVQERRAPLAHLSLGTLLARVRECFARNREWEAALRRTVALRS